MGHGGMLYSLPSADTDTGAVRDVSAVERAVAQLPKQDPAAV